MKQENYEHSIADGSSLSKNRLKINTKYKKVTTDIEYTEEMFEGIGTVYHCTQCEFWYFKLSDLACHIRFMH